MLQFLRGIAFMIVVLLLCEAAVAQDPDKLFSANQIMSGCRAIISKNDAGTSFFQAHCLGIVEAISVVAPDLCIPPGVTTGQDIRVIVKYIDDRPARLHERFIPLALEALRAAWPCKK